MDVWSQNEVMWWYEHIRSLNKYTINTSHSATPVSFEVASDASGIGHFCYVMKEDDKSMLAARAFTEEERKESSTLRELTAFRDTWTNPEVLAKFAGTGIVHYMDNQAMVQVIAKGSRNKCLQPLIVKTVLALRNHGIKMMVVWKSRDDKIINFAEAGSRDFHADDICMEYVTGPR
jgi:phosphopantetheinyl transferase